MGMIHARRGEHVVKVSQKMFDNVLKDCGYELCGQETCSPVSNTDITAFDLPVDNTSSDDVIETTPISEMNKEMLIEYANRHNIDFTDITTVKDMRKAIQEARKANHL